MQLPPCGVRGIGMALAAALALGGAALAQTPSKGAPRKLGIALREKAGHHAPVRVRNGRGPAGVGTLQYDNDVPFSRDGSAPFVGNRFNLGFQDPHSIASVSFRRGGAAATNVIALIFELPVATIGVGYATGLPATTAGSAVFAIPLQSPVIAHSGSFVGGLLNSYLGACSATGLGAPCDGPALTIGTMDPGMGFHAIRLYALGTSGVDIPSRNAIFRVTGDNLPVELLGLGIE